MEKNKSEEYRDDLSNELKDLRSLGEKGREKAEKYLEMAKSTESYQEVRKETVEERNEKISKKKKELGITEERDNVSLENKEDTSVGKLIKILEEAEQKLSDKESFGEDGLKVGEHIKKIKEEFTSFLKEFPKDYLEEKRKNGMTVDDYIYKKLGTSGVLVSPTVENFSEDMEKFKDRLSKYNECLDKQTNPKKCGNRPVLHNIVMNIDRSEYSYKNKKNFPIFGNREKKVAVNNPSLFSPKQREMFLAMVLPQGENSKDFIFENSKNKAGNFSFPSQKSKTKIEGVSLLADRNLGDYKNSGWNMYSLNLQFDREFMSEILNSSINNKS